MKNSKKAIIIIIIIIKSIASKNLSDTEGTGDHISNTQKRVENTMRSGVFLTNFDVFSINADCPRSRNAGNQETRKPGNLEFQNAEKLETRNAANRANSNSVFSNSPLFRIQYHFPWIWPNSFSLGYFKLPPSRNQFSFLLRVQNSVVNLAVLFLQMTK